MNKKNTVLIVLTSLIIILSLISAGLGVFWQGEGRAYEFQTLRGEAVMIQGHGLYGYETVSIAAQAVAQDIVTLLVGIPLLIVSMFLFRKGSLRGKLLLSGTIAYFLYTYASFLFGAAYNILFLLYTALFSLSLFAFILSLMAIDIAAISNSFSTRLPHRSISVFLFIVGIFLLIAWLGRIIPALLANQPPYGLESYTTLIIQALDLGLVVPAAFLSGILLWKKHAWGYLLSSIILIKGATLAIAVTAMAVNMIRIGVEVSIGETLMFPLIALAAILMMIKLMKSVT
jgi:hypothetical protein